MASPLDITAVQPMFDKVDALTQTFVGAMSSNAILTLTPIISIGLTIAFTMFGTLIMLGAVQYPVQEFLKKAFFIGIIVSIAMAGGLYQTHIAEAITTLPDGLATSLLVGTSAAHSTASGLVDSASSQGAALAGRAFDQMSWSSPGYSIVYAGLGILVVAATAFLAGLGAAVLMTCKVALAILAGLGPLFILALLFQSTRQFFALWTTQIANYTILVVLYAAVFGFFMTLFGSYVGEVRLDGLQNVAGAFTVAGIIFVTAVVVLYQLTSIARGLAGGVSLGLSREIARMTPRRRR